MKINQEFENPIKTEDQKFLQMFVNDSIKKSSIKFSNTLSQNISKANINQKGENKKGIQTQM